MTKQFAIFNIYYKMLKRIGKCVPQSSKMGKNANPSGGMLTSHSCLSNYAHKDFQGWLWIIDLEG